jgi:hypothetical protein
MTQRYRRTLQQLATDVDEAGIIIIILVVSLIGCTYLAALAVVVHFVVKFW